jgi:hypothetical protein
VGVAENYIMARPGFTAVAWNNGSHHPTGGGYGLKISAADRDVHFERGWGSVELFLPDSNRPVRVNIDKESLWNDECRDLIHRDTGLWLIRNGMAPRPDREPPRFTLVREAIALSTSSPPEVLTGTSPNLSRVCARAPDGYMTLER